MPVWGSLYFQNSCCFVMEQLIFFHDYIMMVMVMVMVLVGYLLFDSVFMKVYNSMVFEGQELESLWTVIPAVVLLFIAFPSLRLLYVMEELDNVNVSVKVVGSQWFWTYEYGDFGVEEVETYMLSDMGVCRLMETDNDFVLPYGFGVRMIVTSNDVIHSWAVPVVGVSIDAIPGRLNQVFLFLKRPGIFVGQCSEVCGANHSFMPILIKSIFSVDFVSFICLSGRVSC